MWYIRLSLMLLIGGAAAAAAHGERSIDLESFKKDTKIFEGIVSERLKQEFPDPFSLTAEPRTAYLQDYGAVVSFDLSINRASIYWPFGQLSPPKSLAQKDGKDQIRVLKDTMVRCLAHHGNTIRQLIGPERVSLYAHVEDRSQLDQTRNMTVIVMTVKKEDIDAFSERRISFKEFSSRIQIAEY